MSVLEDSENVKNFVFHITAHYLLIYFLLNHNIQGIFSVLKPISGFKNLIMGKINRSDEKVRAEIPGSAAGRPLSFINVFIVSTCLSLLRESLRRLRRSTD